MVVVCVFSLTLCDPMNCSPPGASLHGILRQEHWRGLPFSTPGDPPDLCLPTHVSQVSCISRPTLYNWATWEACSYKGKIITDIRIQLYEVVSALESEILQLYLWSCDCSLSYPWQHKFHKRRNQGCSCLYFGAIKIKLCCISLQFLLKGL